MRAAVRLLPLPPEAFRSLRVEGTDVLIKARHGQDASLTHAMDQVFPEDCSQGDVYDWVAPAVEDVAKKAYEKIYDFNTRVGRLTRIKLLAERAEEDRREGWLEDPWTPRSDFDPQAADLTRGEHGAYQYLSDEEWAQHEGQAIPITPRS